MAYRINAVRPLPKEINRVVREEIEAALHNLRENEDRAVGIHEARKSMKKLRGILLLVRSSLKHKIYMRENARFRDAARQLAQARDSYVVYETLDLLRPHLDDRTVLNALRRYYSRVYRQEQAAILDDEVLLATVDEALQEGVARLKKWTIGDEGFVVMGGNIERVYKRGMRGYRQSRQRGTPEDFHEWRKRVKYLWYHIRLLAPMWDGMMAALASELKQLSEQLGGAHDLVVMDEAIVAYNETLENPYDLTPLLAASQAERTRLEQEALQLGARLYAEAPSDFVARLGLYWDIYQAQQGEMASDV